MERFDTIKFTVSVLLISAIQFYTTYLEGEILLLIALLSGHVLIFLSFLIFNSQKLTIKQWVGISLSYLMYPFSILLLFKLMDTLSQSIFAVDFSDNRFINAIIFGLVGVGNFLFSILTVTKVLRMRIKNGRLVFFAVATFLAFLIIVLGDLYDVPHALDLDWNARTASGIIVLNLLFLLSCYGTFHVKRKGTVGLISNTFPLFSTILFFGIVFYLAYDKPFKSDCYKLRDAEKRLEIVFNKALEGTDELEKGYPDLESAKILQIREGVFKYVNYDEVKKIDDRTEIIAQEMEALKDIMKKRGSLIHRDNFNEVMAGECTQLLKYSIELTDLTEKRTGILLSIYEKRLEKASRKF